MVKEIKDYVEEVQKKFPILSKSEINKILTYGLKMYVYAHRNHCDVKVHNLTDEPVMMHCGRLYSDTLKHYRWWCMKWRFKERVLSKLRGEKWDGYYYIGLTDAENKNVIKKGKTVYFKNIYCTKLKKELYHLKYIKHIWRVPYPMDCGWKFFVKELKSEHAEYIGENQYEKYHQCFRGRTDNG
jgi:hypothetical protein